MLKKTLFILAIILGLALSSCQPGKENHFAIYLLVQDFPATKLSQMDINQLTLENNPVISSDDIISYDKANHIIKLTQGAFTRIQKIFSMPVKVDGVPFVVCVGKERIYTGGFWTPASSLSYAGVVIMQPFDVKEATIQINLGYPVSDVFTGNDPRADHRIIESLKQDKKLK